LTLGELLSHSPRPEGLAFALRDELRRGRVALDAQGRYSLVREAFPPGLLEAIAEVRLA
jgi:hypothetical protein